MRNQIHFIIVTVFTSLLSLFVSADKINFDFNETLETKLLNERDGVGHLHYVEKNDQNKCLWIGVHGINNAPNTILPLSHSVNGCDKSVFIYADQTKRLTTTSKDLENELKQSFNKYNHIIIDAHSMGARVVAHTLSHITDLDSSISLQVNLIAPYFIGARGANLAMLSFWPLDLIKGVMPGKDIGTKSAFQKKLNNIILSADIKVTVWSGDQDEMIHYESILFRNIVNQLNALWVTDPNSDHVTILDFVQKYFEVQGR